MGVFGKFKNIAETLGREGIRGVGTGILATATEVNKLQLWEKVYPWVPTQLGKLPDDPREDVEDLRYTSPIEEQIHTYLLTAGLDELYKTAAAKRRAGQPLTAEELDAITQGAGFLGSLYNGTADVGTQASLELLSYITSAADGDYSSPSFALGLAKIGAGLLPPVSAATQEDDLTKSLMEQQTLVMEQQRIETMTARRNYEREGILSVIQMLPSANRLQFMSAMFQTPKFSQLFFGSLDEGFSEGPYVGGVIGSLGDQGSRFSSTPGAGARDLSVADQIKAWSR
ncbi:hypothetical protein LCGC14_0761510 [marine sediment metagenome]|uniref:Uncharacterized protein n=1 Tax=marine sediment metagenome TaxID=412755 RepID=A0A0F9SL08_9ZZZZ